MNDPRYAVGMTKGRTHALLPMADPLARRVLFIYSCLVPDIEVKKLIASVLAMYRPGGVEEVITPQLAFSFNDMDLVADEGTGLMGFLN